MLMGAHHDKHGPGPGFARKPRGPMDQRLTIEEKKLFRSAQATRLARCEHDRA